MRYNYWICLLVFFSCACLLAQLSTDNKSKAPKRGTVFFHRKKTSGTKTSHDKVANHKRKRKPFGTTNVGFAIKSICPRCIDTKTDCPDKTKKQEEENEGSEGINSGKNTKAQIIRSTNSVTFDVIELEDIQLDIPAFKQFKNNMTDFTSDGEHHFHAIIEKIAVFLGTNYEGKGVTLKITGSASQIPTSFDPTQPNNNINPDGSSILGKTSVANNRKLAKARADELAKKINMVFPSIRILTPKLEEINIGATPWTRQHQLALSKAFTKGNKAAMDSIYAPFQKDQWVKVESNERTSKQIQPEAIKMYMISTTPLLKYPNQEGQEVPIRSVFIVSKKTFDQIGDDLTFDSPEARDKFLENLDLKIFSEVKNGITRWYLLQGIDEVLAFRQKDYNQRIYRLYELGIVDIYDEKVLEEKIIAEVKHHHQY